MNTLTFWQEQFFAGSTSWECGPLKQWWEPAPRDGTSGHESHRNGCAGWIWGSTTSSWHPCCYQSENKAFWPYEKQSSEQLQLDFHSHSYSRRIQDCRPRSPRWVRPAPPVPARSPWPHLCPWWMTSLRWVGKSAPQLDTQQVNATAVGTVHTWARGKWKRKQPCCFRSSTFICPGPVVLVETDRIGAGLGGQRGLHVGQVLCVSQVGQHVLQFGPVWPYLTSDGYHGYQLDPQWWERRCNYRNKENLSIRLKTEMT